MAILNCRNVAKTLVANSGVFQISHRLLNRKKVGIINYHKPTPENFNEHLKYLVRRFNPVSIKVFLRSLKLADPKLLPEYPLIITIDDGFRNNYGLLPCLESFRVPVLLYLVAGIVGTRRAFWFQIARAAGEDVELLKRLPNHERLERLKRRCGWAPDREYPEASALSWDEIRTMQKSGLFDFGAHTTTHPILPSCSQEEARQEMSESKRILEDKLQEPIIHFSYPNGDYTEREVEICKDLGFATGRSTALGWNDISDRLDPFRLTVLGSRETNLTDLKLVSCGYYCVREKLRANRYRL